jgi:hypothetical protein
MANIPGACGELNCAHKACQRQRGGQRRQGVGGPAAGHPDRAQRALDPRRRLQSADVPGPFGGRDRSGQAFRRRGAYSPGGRAITASRRRPITPASRGKDVGRGSRGRSSLKGAADLEPGKSWAVIEDDGRFSTQPKVVTGGGSQFTITIDGTFTPGGFMATVRVDQTAPTACFYLVDWVGVRL